MSSVQGFHCYLQIVAACFCVETRVAACGAEDAVVAIGGVAVCVVVVVNCVCGCGCCC